MLPPTREGRLVSLICFRAHAGAPEISPTRQIGPRSDSRGRAWRRLRRSGQWRGVRGGGQAAAARAIPEQSAVVCGEPAAVRLLARAAGPEGPERLPALRPSSARRRALVPAVAMRPFALLTSLLVLGFAVAGCGGGSDQSAQTLPPP